MTEPVYMDTAATTPVDPRVAEIVMRYMTAEFGNAGSRTHRFGSAAKEAVESARRQIAAVVDADTSDVVFTSGATEANNLALLGLKAHGRATDRTHVVTTAIEHKAVLEPLEQLERDGFEIERVRPDESGAVEASDILARVRQDTLVVSVMHVNNETGVRQPIDAIAGSLPEAVFFHVDGAQGFGKDLDELRSPRIDLISFSGHKVFGPKGIGGLIARRRNRRRPPLSPILFGGGQERGLRPGTLPVPLIAGLGLAAELAAKEAEHRRDLCTIKRDALMGVVDHLGGEVNGNPRLAVPHILNVSFPGVDSEAAILALRDVASISNGSACTSSSYEPSHVLGAMGLPEPRIRGAVRLSWSHDSQLPDIDTIVNALRPLM